MHSQVDNRSRKENTTSSSTKQSKSPDTRKSVHHSSTVSSPSRSLSPSNRSNRSQRSGSPGRHGGRSKSPGKFGEKDFDRRKVGDESLKRRQTALAKVRGLKLEPSQWSRQELLEKLTNFAHFVTDPKTGVGTLNVDGRRLLTEDLQVLLEIMRRVTEIQYISLTGCGLTDDTFLQLLSPGLTGLRHLKELKLQSNLLGTPSVLGIIKSFSKLSRKLTVLDLQLNSLHFRDGKLLFQAFYGSIGELNGISLRNIKQDEAVLEELQLAHKAMRSAELGIVCAMMPLLRRLHTVDVSHNRINASGLHQFVECIKELPNVTTIDISHNPVTNEGSDLSGVQELIQFCKQSTQLRVVRTEGIFHNQLLIGAQTSVNGTANNVHSKEVLKKQLDSAAQADPKLLAAMEETLQRSLMANRSVAGKTDSYYFSKFATNLILSKAKPMPSNKLQNWQGKVNELDLDFITINKIPEVEVNVVLSDYSGTGRDEIMIRQISRYAKNMIEF